VIPVCEPAPPASWNAFVRDWVRRHELRGSFAVLTERPWTDDPNSNYRMEIVDL